MKWENIFFETILKEKCRCKKKAPHFCLSLVFQQNNL